MNKVIPSKGQSGLDGGGADSYSVDLDKPNLFDEFL